MRTARRLESSRSAAFAAATTLWPDDVELESGEAGAVSTGNESPVVGDAVVEVGTPNGGRAIVGTAIIGMESEPVVGIFLLLFGIVKVGDDDIEATVLTTAGTGGDEDENCTVPVADSCF